MRIPKAYQILDLLNIMTAEELSAIRLLIWGFATSPAFLDKLVFTQY
jgi:hypothetical protein